MNKSRGLKKSLKDYPAIRLNDWDDQTIETYKIVYNLIDDVSIMILREEAWKMGVKNATTLSKKELTDQMAQIRTRNIVRIVPFSGDPKPVTDADNQFLLDTHTGIHHIEKAVLTEGLLRIEDTCGWIMPTFVPNPLQDIYVPIRFINDLLLQDGDFVTGLIAPIKNANRYGAYTIETINGVDSDIFVKSTDKIDFDRQGKVIDVEQACCIGQITTGQSVFFCTKVPFDSDIKLSNCQLDCAVSLYRTLKEANQHTIGLFLDEKPSVIHKSKALFDKSDLVAFFDPLQTLGCSETVETFLNHAKTKATLGEDVSIVITNPDALCEKTRALAFSIVGNYTRGSLSIIFLSTILKPTKAINGLVRFADTTHCV
ncbi:MAG: hypothetical protein FWD86_02750 [Firmicutes bacterium]|nr:hypothetical protein [Bacillota bacterium]